MSSRVLEDSRPLRVLAGRRVNSRSFLLALWENSRELVEQELHNLALEHHMNRHICRLSLGAKQCGSEHDGDTLNRHPVRVLVFDHPGEAHTDTRCFQSRPNHLHALPLRFYLQTNFILADWLFGSYRSISPLPWSSAFYTLTQCVTETVRGYLAESRLAELAVFWALLTPLSVCTGS